MITANGDDLTIEDGDNLPEKEGEYKVGDRHPPKESQWKPGQSGNPNGRPAGKSITAELRKLLDKGTTAEELAQVLLDMAKTKAGRDQLAALKELLDRTDGKVAETHKLESDIPINITMKLVKGEDAAKQGEE